MGKTKQCDMLYNGKTNGFHVCVYVGDSAPSIIEFDN